MDTKCTFNTIYRHFFFKWSNRLSKLCNDASYSKTYFDSYSIAFIHLKCDLRVQYFWGHCIWFFFIHCCLFTPVFTQVNCLWLCCHLIQVFVRPWVLPRSRAGFCRVLGDSSLETQSLCGSTRLACVHLQLRRAEGSLCLQQLREGNSLKIRPLQMRRYI